MDVGRLSSPKKKNNANISRQEIMVGFSGCENCSQGVAHVKYEKVSVEEQTKLSHLLKCFIYKKAKVLVCSPVEYFLSLFNTGKYICKINQAHYENLNK